MYCYEALGLNSDILDHFLDIENDFSNFEGVSTMNMDVLPSHRGDLLNEFHLCKFILFLVVLQ